MKYKELGKSKIKVSEFCLGTMTWGQATKKDDAHLQMNMSLDEGINFFDTAELYPTNPIKRETAGETEKILGEWIKKTKLREKIILATKIVGNKSSTVRDGTKINPKNIRISLEGSLKRLNTEYIDLFQLHWPNRGSYHFRKNWNFIPTKLNEEEIYQDFFEVLNCLSLLVKEGKIREFGVSNESAWGVLKYLEVSKKYDLPNIASIQNEYSLLCRSYDTDLSEVSLNENIFLMSYSPLAAGLLTGKYQRNKKPNFSRLFSNPSLGGRLNDRSIKIVNEYLELSKKYSVDLIHLAISFSASRPFMGSVIIGATSAEQLKFLFNGLEIQLDENILKEINIINQKNPLPF